MKSLQTAFRDPVYVWGWILLFLSTLAFVLPQRDTLEDELFEAFFLLNALFAVTYVAARMLTSRHSNRVRKIRNHGLFLGLGLLSAFALNRSLEVFDQLSSWFAVSLVVAYINLLVMGFFPDLPQPWKIATSAINGVAFLLFMYMAIYTLPLYPWGLVGALALGLGLHIFIPLFLAIYSLRIQLIHGRHSRIYLRGFFSGIVGSLLLLLLFLVKWQSTAHRIHKLYEAAYNDRADLPVWLRVGQELEQNMMTRYILNTGSHFRAAGKEFRLGPSLFFGRWGNQQIHDPLVFIATRIFGTDHIAREDASRILNTWRDNRHESESQLWSGENLATDTVQTHVKMWPACNISYTEKTIIVSKKTGPRLGRPGEAIYSFLMPEGTVVSSLSLWVNGVEERGILTTRSKADLAYKTIVGVESRDPSVVHWQEGNRVTVRVFPVEPGKSRQFKIGFTTPLKRQQGKLVYSNIHFRGPAYEDAVENTTIEFDEPVTDIHKPARFAALSKRSYQYQGAYNPLWTLQVDEPALTSCGYESAGNTYYLDVYHPQLGNTDIRNIYLDINALWTVEEVANLLNAFPEKRFFVENGSIEELNHQNLKNIFRDLQRKQFSFFPLYRIMQPEYSVLVCKSGASQIYLDHLKESAYYRGLKQMAGSDRRIRVFDLADRAEPVMRTLMEFRLVNYVSGDLDYLKHLVSTQRFPMAEEDDTKVILPESGLMIRRTAEKMRRSGPDHVMRLFVYNHTMLQAGPYLMKDLPLNDALVREAREAHIVTPFTSLLVLETREDYKRFDVSQAPGSLGNASMANSGAAPEPHEWALIALGVLFLFFTARRRLAQRVS